MKKEEGELAANAADSFPINGTMESNSLFTRREMLGMAGLAAMPDAVAQTARKRPRIACLVSYWGLPTLWHVLAFSSLPDLMLFTDSLRHTETKKGLLVFCSCYNQYNHR